MIDLTGVTAVLQMRMRSADEEIGVAPLLELNTTNGGLVIDATNGYITLNITATQTGQLRFSRCLFEMEATTANGIVVSLLKGDVRVTKEIVR